MFTNTKAGYVRDGKVLTESACLSTDTKPTTGIANGSCLIEMDTGDRYMFDEAGSQWLNITHPGGGGGAEVWLTGDNPETEDERVFFALSNVGETDHIAELLNNGANYQVFLNGEELPYYLETYHAWIDTEDTSQMTKSVQMNNETTAYAFYFNVTVPTSVEVSVKAK